MTSSGRHGAASDANDFEAEHEIICHDDAVLECPQSGERTRRRAMFKRLVLRSRTRDALRCGASNIDFGRAVLVGGAGFEPTTPSPPDNWSDESGKINYSI